MFAVPISLYPSLSQILHFLRLLLAVPVLISCSGGDSDPANVPPVLKLPANATISYSRPSVIEWQLSDPDSEIVTLHWELVSFPPGGTMSVMLNDINAQSAEFHGTEKGTYVVIITATDGVSETSGKLTITVANLPPVLPAVNLEPMLVTRQDDAFVLHEPIIDPDRDILTVEYQWAVNGSIVEITDTPYLPIEFFARGDLLAVTVKAFDAEHTVTITSPGLVVGNSPPTISNIRVYPTAPDTTETLTAFVADLADADVDAIVTSYEWLVNDQVVPGHTGDTFPAGVAKYPDTVSVRVTISDGFDTAEFQSNTLSLEDAPSEFLGPQSVSKVNYGEQISVQAKFVDPDGLQLQTVLRSGPAGMTYNEVSGAVEWTPVPLMLGKTETFYATFESSDGEVQSLPVVVSAQETPVPLARSGVESPQWDTRLSVGDYDQDGVNEILSTDTKQRIFTLEVSADEVVQNWLYPFPLELGGDIKGLWPFGEEQKQILVVSEEGVSIIPSRSARPETVYRAPSEITSVEMADVNLDGQLEIVMIQHRVLHVIDTDTWSPIYPSIRLQDNGALYFSLAVGNVDSDEGIEIVTSNGQVFDGASGSVEWDAGERFSYSRLLAIGDIDGDGNNEIVGSGVYSAILKKKTVNFSLNDICTLQLHNFDNDPAEELFQGDCQFGALTEYDLISGELVKKNEYKTPYSSRQPHLSSGHGSVNFADIDSDGYDELIFATGTRSSVHDRTVVVSSMALENITENTMAFNRNPAETGFFFGRGWLNADSTDNKLVVVLPDTSGNEWGQRVGLLSQSGDFVISDKVGLLSRTEEVGEVLDSDNDGIAEVLVPDNSGLIGSDTLLHINLPDFSLTQSINDYGTTDGPPLVEVLASGDSARGQLVTVGATSDNKLNLYDIATGSVLWRSDSLGLTINELVVLTGNDSKVIVGVATAKELQLWTLREDELRKLKSIDVNCDQLTALSIRGSAYLSCMESDDKSVITLFDLELQRVNQIELPYKITALTATPGDQLLVASEVERDYYLFDGKLHLVDPLGGYEVWTSRPLIGSFTGLHFHPNPSKGAVKLAATTQKVMYLFK